MTIDDDVQSLLAMEQYLHQSKTDVCILLDELAKIVQAHIAPITITAPMTITGNARLASEIWGTRQWMFNHPRGGNLTSNIAIKDGHFTIRPPAGTHWRDTRTYELSNPEFPNNLLTDLKIWLEWSKL